MYLATSHNWKPTGDKKIVFWREVEKTIIIPVRSLRQAQPGTWKIPIKPDTEDLINLLLSLIDFTKFPFFAQTHRL